MNAYTTMCVLSLKIFFLRPRIPYQIHTKALMLVFRGVVRAATDKDSVVDRANSKWLCSFFFVFSSPLLWMLSSIFNGTFSQYSIFLVLHDFVLDSVYFRGSESFAFISLQRVGIYFYTLSSCIFLTLSSCSNSWLMLIRLHLAILIPSSLPVPFLLIQWKEEKKLICRIVSWQCLLFGACVWCFLMS